MSKIWCHLRTTTTPFDARCSSLFISEDWRGFPINNVAPLSSMRVNSLRLIRLDQQPSIHRTRCVPATQ